MSSYCLILAAMTTFCQSGEYAQLTPINPYSPVRWVRVMRRKSVRKKKHFEAELFTCASKLLLQKSFEKYGSFEN